MVVWFSPVIDFVNLEKNMGGMGSSRWGARPTKHKTDGCLSVDIRALKRAEKLMPGVHVLSWSSGSSMAVMINADVTNALFRFQQRGQSYSTSAGIDYTPCQYGGERPWFVCGCGKRYAVLYVASGSIACRSCQNLLYTSQVETDADRAIRKARNLSVRLGFGPDLINGGLLHGHKRPPGMSQRVWDRLYSQYQNARIRAILMV